MAATPSYELRNGLQVYHPRYVLPPKVGQNIAPFTLAAGALPTIRRLIQDGFDFDVIDAHFFYPDGVAAAIIARKIGKPFVCTARGSDITLYRQFATPNRLIRKTLAVSAANIGVCADLVEQMIELGADPAKSHALRNGVDLVRFAVIDREQARQRLGLPAQGMVLVSVGHLVEVKGHHLVIELIARLPSAHLVIVGSGPWAERLKSLAQSLGVQDRVHFAGSQPNDQLKTYYSAANALVLASSREGWANVLLEAMACGTPVVATRVNGTPEVVASPHAGRLADIRDVEHLHKALTVLLANYPTQVQVRAYAELFSWEETTRLQHDLFSSIISRKT
jgi:glycosyltransferase involved in cell wall biosynthesis